MSSTSTHHNQPENLTSNHLPANATASQPLLLVCRLSKRAQTLGHLMTSFLALRGTEETPPRCRAHAGRHHKDSFGLGCSSSKRWGRSMGPIFFNSIWGRSRVKACNMSHSTKLNRCVMDCQAAPSPAICVYLRRQFLQPQRPPTKAKTDDTAELNLAMQTCDFPKRSCPSVCVCLCVAGKNSEQSNNPSLVMLVVGSALDL